MLDHDRDPFAEMESPPMTRVALINAPLKSAVCDFGVGHQMPLGLLMVGGALQDRCTLTLIDAARDHLTEAEIVGRVASFGADIAMIAHVGSTQAHPCCLRTLAALKTALPNVLTVYGGVHPTYHAREILAEHTEVDIIVRGEGEATVAALIEALDRTRTDQGAGNLAHVSGIVWRRGDEIIVNPARAPIIDLDSHPIAWELIDDWDKYRAFGLGRSAVVQFSRGCPHTCTYCGQWMFWKNWRHRDPVTFVDELERLRREHDVRFVWLADENPTTLKDVWRSVLEELARRDLGLGICASIRAQDIVRDEDMLHLYRQAGFLYVLMGVETVTDVTLGKIRKGSSVDDAYRAVRLLRRHGILSIVDYIFGLEEETPGTIWRGLKGLLRYDGDFVNALYLTPHSWTALGRALGDAPIVETDLWRWDYRHQVVGVKHLTPAQLLLGVKLVELIYHLNPRLLWRLVATPDRRARRQLQHCASHIAKVFWFEVFEAVADRLRAHFPSRRATAAEGHQNGFDSQRNGEAISQSAARGETASRIPRR
jgi:anaerobic magnesium-protoporphyrin IX monomethyl ester cyclase